MRCWPSSTRDDRCGLLLGAAKVFLLLWALCAAAIAFSDDGSTRDVVETEVQAAFDSLVAASRALDMERYLEHFDRERFMGLNSDGRTWQSLADLEPLVRGGFSATETVLELNFPVVKISVIDDFTAVLINEFELTSRKLGLELVT